LRILTNPFPLIFDGVCRPAGMPFWTQERRCSCSVQRFTPRRRATHAAFEERAW
jgi:hypothetical protein